LKKIATIEGTSAIFSDCEYTDISRITAKVVHPKKVAIADNAPIDSIIIPPVTSNGDSNKLPGQLNPDTTTGPLNPPSNDNTPGTNTGDTSGTGNSGTDGGDSGDSGENTTG